ncbi:uncharacterized protein LOC143003085 [Genypterus blacodes]|uniref:uncharacterized protein LOC143003085 n=1 Tax=Genypterus blacodes TaxID=154954 RepID=UPI003F7623EE
MMEIKLRVAFFVLLLINLGSSEQGEDDTAVSNSPVTLGPDPVLDSQTAVPSTGPHLDPHNGTAPLDSLDTTNKNTGVSDSSSSSSSISSSSSTVPAGGSGSVTPIIPHSNTATQANQEQASTADLPTLPPLLGNENLTNQLKAVPSILPSENNTSASPFPAATTATSSPAHTAPADPAPNLSTTQPSGTPQPDLPHTTPLQTHSPTSTPALQPAGEPLPPNSETLTTVSTQSSSTSSPSSDPEPPNPQPPQTTSHSAVEPQVSTVAHPTLTPPSSPPAQAKAHVDIPSQLTVGGDATVAHDSPTLDPLLAGLVSAFIITAVIITLLLFLKLRRRDNRPEFRRLQDLPMDDMMEDTPLSMYSY